MKRFYALAKANGKKEAIIEAEKIKLTDNHLYHSLLAELYLDSNREKALVHLKTALALAKTTTDRNIISKKIHALQ